MKHDSCSEESYPYTAKGGIFSTCKSSGCDVAMPSGTVKGVKSISGLIGSASDKDLMAAAQQQPVSIAIEADQDIFQHYTSGVITGNCGTNTDHGVLLVGYGTDSGTDYWKVKNSWGASWGMNGYILIQRGVNKCGIADGPPSYPTVNGAPGPAPTPTPPAPTPPPTPTPTPTPPSDHHHYGAPPCLDDEIEGEFEGGGKLCAAPCDASGACSTDFPEGMSDPQPQCILQDQDTGDQYC